MPSYYITRAASWAPDRRKWLFSAVRGGIWNPHSPVPIKISADKRPLNQLTVKNIFFSLNIITFCHQHHRIIHEKAINLSVWMKEICTLLVKLHIIFTRMQRVNQHAFQVECPTCYYQVCAQDQAKGGAADLDYHPEPCHCNDLNQCRIIINLSDKLQWNLIQNTNIFLQNMHLKMWSAKWWPFCLGLNVEIFHTARKQQR